MSRLISADVFTAMANNEVGSVSEPEPEIQPLPQTEGIEQQLKNAPLKAEPQPAEVKPAESNESETSESSGEAPAGKSHRLEMYPPLSPQHTHSTARRPLHISGP